MDKRLGTMEDEMKAWKDQAALEGLDGGVTFGEAGLPREGPQQLQDFSQPWQYTT